MTKSNQIQGLSSYKPDFAPSLLAGAAAYGGAKLFTGLSGNVTLPIVGNLDAPLAFGASVAASSLLTDTVGKFVLPRIQSIIPIKVSPTTERMIIVPAIAGAASSYLVGTGDPFTASREGYAKLAVIGGASYLLGKQGSEMLGLNW